MGGLSRVVALMLAVVPCVGACGGPDDGAAPAAPSTTAPTTGAATTGAAVASAVVPVNGGKTAVDLGIETKGGTFTPLIDRGTALPATHRESFTTAQDNQPTIQVAVFRGTSIGVADAQLVGRYELTVPKPQPRGVPQIAVTFKIDTTGKFQLTATDATSDTAVTVTETT